MADASIPFATLETATTLGRAAGRAVNDRFHRDLMAESTFDFLVKFK